MIYQIKHTNNKRLIFGSKLSKILLVFFLFFGCLFLFSYFKFTGNFFSNISHPFQSIGNQMYESFPALSKFFTNKRLLVEENAKLLEEVERMRLGTIGFESLKIENHELRKSIDLKSERNSIAAAVISRPPQIHLDSLIIDKGYQTSVNEGDPVFVGEKFLIGNVAKSYPNTATVVLNSFPEKFFQGFVLRTNEPIEIEGIGGGNMSALVPINFDIAIGDLVMFESSIPYVAAIVGVIEENDSLGFKNILLSLPTNISRVRLVFVEPKLGE